MLTIGNGELDNNPDIPDELKCPHCGKTHPIEYGVRIHEDGSTSPSSLAFYKCGKKSYLCGFQGKLLKF